MSYRSEVGIRIAVKQENAGVFFCSLFNTYKEYFGIKDDTLVLEEKATPTLQSASDFSSDFFNIIAKNDNLWSNIVEDEEIKVFFDEKDMPDYFIVEAHYSGIKWYNNVLTDFWEHITSEDSPAFEWSWCKIGEEIDDINYNYSEESDHIDILLPYTSIDW